VRATSAAKFRANRSNEPLVNGLSDMSSLCSGRRRPSAVVTKAVSDEGERTRTSTLKASPATCSIAEHSASAPPEAPGSLAPSTTRQAAGLAEGEFIAQALPLAEAIVTAKTAAVSFLRIQLSD
jgi:hypothetical protein